MTILFYIALFGLLLWTVRNTLFWISLWQDKEYRLDRLFVHFRETSQGKKIFFSFGNIIKNLLLIIFFLLPLNFLVFFQLAVFILFTVQGVLVIKSAFERKIKRPIFTIKTGLLVILSLATVFAVYNYSFPDKFFRLIAVDRLLPFTIAGFVILFAIPTYFYKAYVIARAKAKIKKLKILVIAVSGSYGKTSTKEYIAQILSKKFNTTKTFGSNNTPIGIAKTILNYINEKTEIFVVEMGAYKKGEIRELCEIIRPDISVTTAISDQHLSLYGSLGNVLESEFELIEALPKDAVSLFNKNSPLVEKLYGKTKNKKYYYGTDFKTKPEIEGKNIRPTINGVSFEVAIDGAKINFSTPLLGEHTVENILPAIFLARHLKIPVETIKEAVLGLVPPPKTLRKVSLINGAIGIDDTFNSSPEAVFAAAKFISLGVANKYFVFTPLTELGQNGRERHIEIGESLGKTCDHVFVLNQNFREQIIEGIEEDRDKTKLSFIDTKDAAAFLHKALKKDDIVIFEGKEAALVMKKLI